MLFEVNNKFAIQSVYYDMSIFLRQVTMNSNKKIAEFLYKKIRPANAGRTYDNTQ